MVPDPVQPAETVSVEPTGQPLLSNGLPRPVINAIRWTPVADVLPDEARDFTPWLAENLHLLAPVLGLEDLELVQREYAVAGFSLDILAKSLGADDQPVWVAIENQYRRTDHGHLGQLLTYTAHAAKDQERVMAVWITEEAHPAHTATIEFLNRTANPVAGVGYFLVQVRFAPGPNGTHHVFFQVLASPNAFLRSGIQGEAGAASRPQMEARRVFMSRIYDSVRPAAMAAGASRATMDAGGWQITLRFPATTELAQWPSEIWVRLPAGDVAVQLAAPGARHSADENAAFLDLVHEARGQLLEQALPPETPVNWHAGYAGYATDYAQCLWGQGGYLNGDVGAAADWASKVCAAWLSVLVANPLHGIAEAVAARLGSGVGLTASFSEPIFEGSGLVDPAENDESPEAEQAVAASQPAG
jgi:hypothetical protein